MKTYTNLRTDVSQGCNVNTSDTTKMTTLEGYINDSIRTICNLNGGKLRFLETTKDMVTVASQEGYEIPNKFRKIIDMYIYSGTGASTDSLYTPEMIFDPTKWKTVKQMKMGESNVPVFTYVENTKYYIQPIPSTSSNKITLRGRLRVRDLSIADYTTGTIVSIANEGTALVGDSTTWTADMVGRYVKIADTTAANGGDGFWYEIGAYVSATALTLVKPYEGTAIVAGSGAYTIGQVSPIPEAYQPAIAYRAIALYWQNQNDRARAKDYWMLYDGGNEAGLNTEYGGLISQMIVTEGETEEGAYIPPSQVGGMGTNNYYYPDQNASGLT